MPKLLVIEASPRGQFSVSRRIGERFARNWLSTHGNGEVKVVDLYKTDVPFVGLPWIGGAYRSREQHSPEMADAIRVSDGFVADLKSADELLIATPMYNFSIPAVLKAWVDHVLRVGVTFNERYEGLLPGKKATIVLASAGDYSPGSPFEAANTAASYMRQALGFIGISDVNIVLAGSTRAIDQGHTTLDEYVASHGSAAAA